jgi:hypothetical protein
LFINKKNYRKSIIAFGFIFLLLFSLIKIISFDIPEYDNVSATSIWIKESDDDFNDGDLENLTIYGSGSEGDLRLSVFESSDWKNITQSLCPSARYAHSMSNIFNTDKILLFGGWDNTWPHFKNDTWMFDLSDKSWVNKNPTLKPNASTNHKMAFVYGTDKIVLYMGSETWIYDYNNNTWTDKTPYPKPANYPSYRGGFALAPVLGDDKILLFGGAVSTPFHYNNDIWIYDVSEDSWEFKNPSGNKPYGRRYHAIAPVFGTKKFILFGGNGVGTYSGTWIYDLNTNTWTEKSIMGNKPDWISHHTMVSIFGTDKVLLFGGSNYTGILNDTWIYDLSANTWTLQNQITKPCAREDHAMAAIYGAYNAILFGGQSTHFHDDTWVYSYYSYLEDGTYVSEPFDTQANSSFKKFIWNGIVPLSTTMRFQIRTGQDLSDLYFNNFLGPNGKTSLFYFASPSTIWFGHTGDRWIQYKTYFSTADNTETPILDNVTIIYNCLPDAIPFSPRIGNISNDPKPKFDWSFIDLDSIAQAAFQVLIDDDLNFNSINYDSKVMNSETSSWQFPEDTMYTLLEDGIWYWKVRVKDSDGDWGPYSTPWAFQIDTTPPSTTIVLPVNNVYYNSLETIFGIASDPEIGTGINRIEISIKRFNDNKYWKGGTWIGKETWVTARGYSNWDYDAGKITWTSGVPYQIQTRAVDNATNVEVIDEGCTFIMDLDRPSSNVEFPLNGSYLNSLESIFGSSMDTGGSGISQVEICILRSTDKHCWSGIQWNSCEVWLDVDGKEDWLYDASGVAWTTDTKYTIYSKATDIAGNIESISLDEIFTFDNQPPHNLTILINNNNEFTNYTNITLSIDAFDTTSPDVQFALSIDRTTWSTWEELIESISFELSASDGEKTIYLKVKDLAGNVAEPVSDSIILDQAPPEDVTIVINDDMKFTNSNLCCMNISAKDSLSGIDSISFSNDGLIWTKWELFNKTKFKYFTPPDGDKFIYLKVKDRAGNIATTIDSITLDTTPPHSLEILINNGSSETNSKDVTLNLQAMDDLSGVYQVSISSDKKTWSKWEVYSETKSYRLPSGDGKKTIYFKVKDMAGNEAEPVSDTIQLKEPFFTFDTLGLGILIIIIVVVILIIMMLFIRIKKKKIKDSTQKTTSKPKEAPVVTGSSDQQKLRAISDGSLKNIPLNGLPTQQQQNKPPSFQQQVKQPTQLAAPFPQLYQSPQYIQQIQLQPQVQYKTFQQNICQNCGQSLIYNAQSNSYFCPQCNRF